MENEKSNYSECSAFIRKLTDSSVLNSRFSESKQLVEKAVSGDEVDSRIDLDDLETLGAPEPVERSVEYRLNNQAKQKETPVVIETEEKTVEPEKEVVKAETKSVETKKKADDVISTSSDTSYLRLVIKSEGQSTKVKEKASKTAHVIGLIFTYAFLIVMAILFLFPFYWMIITSFKSGSEIKGFLQGYEGKQTFWPVQFTNNYAGLTKKFNFGMYVGNTLVVGLFSTIGTIFTCIFAAFAFARLDFKGKDFMFTLLLATMMIPGEMMVVTNYISVSNFGWTGGNRTGAYLSMIIPFMVSVFYIYLLRQNFMQIPNELYLAAKVDGKTDWQYLWKVMVPLAMPSLVTIFILKLMGSWNSYIWPNLIAGGHDEFKLVSNGLRDSFQTGSDFNEYGKQMAATVCVTLPLLLVFICFRKYIMRGVSRAGIKG